MLCYIRRLLLMGTASNGLVPVGQVWCGHKRMGYSRALRRKEAEKRNVTGGMRQQHAAHMYVYSAPPCSVPYAKLAKTAATPCVI